MTLPASPTLSHHHRFPGESISHAVWVYFRFPLGPREEEAFLFVRGVMVFYEAIRTWGRTFGQPFANQLRRRCLRPGDTWHVDEVLLTIKPCGRDARDGVRSQRQPSRHQRCIGPQRARLRPSIGSRRPQAQ